MTRVRTIVGALHQGSTDLIATASRANFDLDAAMGEVLRQRTADLVQAAREAVEKTGTVGSAVEACSQQMTDIAGRTVTHLTMVGTTLNERIVELEQAWQQMEGRVARLDEGMSQLVR